MIVAMAQDVRVILIKLADRLHNMRTIEYLGKQAQVQKAKETLEVYAPLAHRLGIHAMKWELEDLCVRDRCTRASTPRSRRWSPSAACRPRGRTSRRPSDVLRRRAGEGRTSRPRSPGRAKHFYSIYDKMAKKGREFNEIYDLTAMRVTVERAGDEGTRDCYGALGLIHSLWKPMPGRFKDYIAMPKFNRYRVAAHDRDRARGHAARDPGADARDARRGRVRHRARTGSTSAGARASRTTSGSTWVQAARWTGRTTRPTRASS